MSFVEIDRQQREWDERARVAQGAAAHAYARLLDLAERRDIGQDQCIAQFLASTYNGEAFPFDLFELPAVDVEISDDMLACLVRCDGARLTSTSWFPMGTAACAW